MIGYRWNISGRNEREQFAIGATHLNFTSLDDGEYGVNHVGKISPLSKARDLLSYGYHHPSGSRSSNYSNYPFLHEKPQKMLL
jgi:hypothetical protein